MIVALSFLAGFLLAAYASWRVRRTEREADRRRLLKRAATVVRSSYGRGLGAVAHEIEQIRE